MPAVGSRGVHALLPFLAAYPYTVATVVALGVMGIIAVARRSSEWDDVYVGSARELLAGRDFYQTIKGFTYPPFSTWFFIPFTWLPIRVARAIWFCVNAASLVALITLAWRLAGGRRLQPVEIQGKSAHAAKTQAGRPCYGGDGEPRGEADIAPPREADIAPLRETDIAPLREKDIAPLRETDIAPLREQIAFWVGHAIALQLSLNALTHLQTDLPIAALLMLGCAGIVREKYYHAAGAIGLAAAFKLTPLLFAPYLMLRRKWSAGLLLVAVSVGANLLPNLIAPPGGGIWLVRWAKQYLLPMARPGYVPGDWKNLLNNNQALTGAASRWITSSWREDSANLRTIDRPGYSPEFLRKRIAAKHRELSAEQVSRAASKVMVRAVWMALVAGVLLPVLIALRVRAVANFDGRDGPDNLFLVSMAQGERARRLASLTEDRRRLPALPDERVIECGIVLLLMLLLSPNSSRAHFCVLYLPAFCLARLAVRPGASRVLIALVALAVMACTLSVHLRLSVTMTVEQIFLWLGVVMFATIFLLLGSCVAIVQPARRPVRSNSALA